MGSDIELLTGFTEGIRSFAPVLSWVAILLGLYFGGMGLMMLARQSSTGMGREQVGQSGSGRAIATVIVGASLIASHHLLDMLMQTGGLADESADILSPECATKTVAACDYGTASADNAITQAVLILGFTIVQTVGGFGFLRGLVLFKPVAGQNVPVGRAITHIIGGAFAINIVPLLEMLGETGGPGLSGVIKGMVGS